MGRLCRFLRQRGVVVGGRRHRVERQVELVAPAKLKARVRKRVVARLGEGVPLGQVGRVGGNLVGDDAGFDVVPVGQAEVFLW